MRHLRPPNTVWFRKPINKENNVVISVPTQGLLNKALGVWGLPGTYCWALCE